MSWQAAAILTGKAKTLIGFKFGVAPITPLFFSVNCSRRSDLGHQSDRAPQRGGFAFEHFAIALTSTCRTSRTAAINGDC